MLLRLKKVRQLEQRINKVRELMDMYHVNPNQSYNYYQPVGGSSLLSNSASDPKIAKTRELFQMFGLTR